MARLAASSASRAGMRMTREDRSATIVPRGLPVRDSELRVSRARLAHLQVSEESGIRFELLGSCSCNSPSLFLLFSVVSGDVQFAACTACDVGSYQPNSGATG